MGEHVTEFTEEQIRDQKRIGRELASLGWERPVRSVCLSVGDLASIFNACNTDVSPLVQRALEQPGSNMIVNGRMFRGVTKPAVLKREAKTLAAIFHVVLEQTSFVHEEEALEGGQNG